MTVQQMQLKIEQYLTCADRRLLDSFPLPGGRARLFVANPQSYLCNYAVVTEWLDADETIEAAEEEFAGRGISPCRFYGAPDSVDLEALRPAFLRHGYAVRAMYEVETMAFEGPIPPAPVCEGEMRWVEDRLDEDQRRFVTEHPHGGEYSLKYLARVLRLRAGKILFAYRDGLPTAGLLYLPRGDTVMITDEYTSLDYRPGGLGTAMIAQAVQLFGRQGMQLLFLQASSPDGKRFCRECGFVPVPIAPVWWAVKGGLPDWMTGGKDS